MLTVAFLAACVLVLALIGYLSAVAWALHEASRNVAAQADSLTRAAQITVPLGQKLTTVSDGFVALAEILRAVNGHLDRV